MLLENALGRGIYTKLPKKREKQSFQNDQSDVSIRAKQRIDIHAYLVDIYVIYMSTRYMSFLFAKMTTRLIRKSFDVELILITTTR